MQNTSGVAVAAAKPTATWFYGTVANKEEFLEYVTSTYSRSKCLAIIPTELVEIATEALAFAKYFNVELPSHFQDIVVDPLVFSADAVKRGIDPEPSEVTKINELSGKDFKNMIEFFEAQEKDPELAQYATHGFPVVAGDMNEEINDESAYLSKLAGDEDSDEDEEDDEDDDEGGEIA